MRLAAVLVLVAASVSRFSIDGLVIGLVRDRAQASKQAKAQRQPIADRGMKHNDADDK